MILSPSMLSSDFANMETELKALEAAGIHVVKSPAEIGNKMREVLG